MNKLLCVSDYERTALSRLPPSVRGFLAGGAEDNISLRENRCVFDRLGFRIRGLTGVADRTQACELFGRRYASPIGIAPMGAGAIFAYECDAALTGAAIKQQIPCILSGMSNIPMETLAQQAPGFWYQAYLPGDQQRISPLLQRLQDNGVDTLVVTLDTAVGANRENNQRAGFTIPFRLSPRLAVQGMLHPLWTLNVFARTLKNHGVPRFSNVDEGLGHAITESPPGSHRAGRDLLTWEHLRAIRTAWQGRLIVKGVLHPEDAAQACAEGLDGVIVSNHGGRQMDGAISPLQALPEIVAAVPSNFPVMIDSGFRRGTDVLKAIALGAKMVFIGRPMIYGAIIDGQNGVARVIEILKSEIDRNQALIGCANLVNLTSEYLTVIGAPSLSSARIATQGDNHAG